MKSYEQLTPEQQTKAQSACLDELLVMVVNQPGSIPNLRAKIEAAWKKAEKMQTPWFVGEYIMDTCGDRLKKIAGDTAKTSFYPELGEHITEGAW